MSRCWEYGGSRDRHGYGRSGSKLVHRLVFEAIYGYLPSVVRHRCDNPPCYNPAHLLPGTQADNVQDTAARGRNHQQRKTLCPRGHTYSGVNNRGRRVCAICLREQSRQATAKWRSKRAR